MHNLAAYYFYRKNIPEYLKIRAQIMDEHNGDPGLSPIGVAEALSCRYLIDAITTRTGKVPRIFCSPSRRTQETAQLIADKLPIILVPGLVERHWGPYETPEIAEGQDIMEHLGHIHQLKRDPHYSVWEVQSLAHKFEELRSEARMLYAQAKQGPILVVSHGETLRLTAPLLQGPFAYETAEVNDMFSYPSFQNCVPRCIPIYA